MEVKMELIKKGNPPKMWYGRCTCCGAVFSETNANIFADGQSFQQGSYNNDYEDYVWRHCTECKKVAVTVCFHKEGSASVKRLKKEAKIK